MLLRTGFTATSTRSQRARGVTLVEMMFSIGIGGIVGAALLLFAFYTGRNFAAMANYVALEKQSRSALDRMARDIRMVNGLTSFSSNKLSFLDHDSKPLVYEYFPKDRTLVRSKDSVVETYLTECDSLKFDIFQRNPVGGTYDQYPASIQASNTKVVRVSWTCSRKVVGAKINTESVQAARIVIRNQ